MTACTTTPSREIQARVLMSLRRPARITAYSTRPAAAATTKVRVRLPNSMAWWIQGAAPATGTSEPSWHSGQVSQPRPEPVTRTSEPVTVMPPWHSSSTIARVRCSFSDGSRQASLQEFGRVSAVVAVTVSPTFGRC